MRRLLAALGIALTMACANGGLDGESAATADAAAQQAVVSCTSARLPKSGERCDTSEVPAAAYCRLGSCDKQCEDECFCRSNGRWECLLFCRDSYGCGTTPICGVNCADAAVVVDTAVAADSESPD